MDVMGLCLAFYGNVWVTIILGRGGACSSRFLPLPFVFGGSKPPPYDILGGLAYVGITYANLADHILPNDVSGAPFLSVSVPKEPSLSAPGLKSLSGF